MRRQLESILWYLARPRLYPQLVQVVLRRIVGPDPRDNTRAEAKAWCERQAVSTEEALRILTGAQSLPQVTDLHAGTFAQAEEAARNCPVRMGGPGDLTLLYHLAEHCKATSIVETGVAYGWSSLALLLSLQNRSDGRLISTDMPYRNRNNDAYVGCVVPADLRRNWTIIRMADRQALPKALAQLRQLDLCHYDSDKSYAGRMWAYPRLWQAIRAGGFFISDDIGDNKAFADFCTENGLKPVIVRKDNKFIGIIAKPAA
jgi:predicted O-methyltransferase YrrM